MKSRHLSLVFALVFCGAAVFAQGQDDQANPQTTAATPAAGSKAPDFELKVLGSNGKTLQLSSLKGQAVIVSFWATWCEPCRIEMPALVELQKKYAAQGLQVVGISMDDAEEKEVSDFARKMGVNYPVLQGTERVADLYGGVDALPMTFWLDRSGKVVTSAVGLESESKMEEAIKKSLAKENSTTASAK